jgi:insertion element IS1 protein InsB
MLYVPVQCPHCQSTEVIKAGKQANGIQRYQCQNGQCARRIFLLQYQDRGRMPEIRRQVVAMALNGSGIRDTARVLRISPTTVIAVLKKIPALHAVHPALIPPPRARDGAVSSGRAAEIDEMWSFVGAKATERWLWHAIDHHSGQVLAYVFGQCKDTVFLQLQALLEPFGITRFYTDGWGAYKRRIDSEKHEIGKQHPQTRESKHINLRTRMTLLQISLFARGR